MTLQQTGWFWDPRKAAANIAKHGVSFEFATLVFEDPFQLNESDDHPDGGNTLFVVHTFIEPDLSFGRIISARRATPHEKRRYEESLLS
jgi:uncharacterized DUF497 family protein